MPLSWFMWNVTRLLFFPRPRKIKKQLALATDWLRTVCITYDTFFHMTRGATSWLCTILCTRLHTDISSFQTARPYVLLKECNLFQMLKGSVFLIIDILVKISIWCCLTPQTWVTAGWPARSAAVGAGGFQGQGAHWQGIGEGRGVGGWGG